MTRGLAIADAIVGVGAIVKFWRGLSELECLEAPPASTTQPTVALLVPLLDERAYVESIVANLLSLDYDTSLLRVVLITSEVEGDGNDSTHAVCRRAIESSNARNIVLLHAPVGSPQRKATQLNFALEHLAAQPPDWVGVYDADSTPDPRSLTELAARARVEPWVQVFQQSPIYLNRWTERDRWMRAEAVLQSARSLCVEAPRIRRSGSKQSPGYYYLIGHGQFFKYDLIAKCRFPVEPVIDDLPLGKALAAANIPAGALSTRDFCTVPTHVSTFVRQSEIWFAGHIDLRSVRRTRETLDGTSRLPFKVVAGALSDVVPWAARLPHLVLSALASVPPRGSLIRLLRHLGVLTLETYLEHGVVRRVGQPIPGWRPTWVLRPAVKSLGALTCLARAFIGRPTLLQKTPR